MRRQARWRARVADRLVAEAMADRFLAAVAAGPASMRWTYRQAFHLSAMDLPQSRLSVRAAPPGALLFAPVPDDVVPRPGASDGEVWAFFDEVSRLATVAELASFGWLTAAEAEAWLWRFTARCCVDLDVPLERYAAELRRVQGLYLDWLALHTVDAPRRSPPHRPGGS